eukprot:Opistho-1_new@104074
MAGVEAVGKAQHGLAVDRRLEAHIRVEADKHDGALVKASQVSADPSCTGWHAVIAHVHRMLLHQQLRLGEHGPQLPGHEVDELLVVLEGRIHDELRVRRQLEWQHHHRAVDRRRLGDMRQRQFGMLRAELLEGDAQIVEEVVALVLHRPALRLQRTEQPVERHEADEAQLQPGLDRTARRQLEGHDRLEHGRLQRLPQAEARIQPLRAEARRAIAERAALEEHTDDPQRLRRHVRRLRERPGIGKHQADVDAFGNEALLEPLDRVREGAPEFWRAGLRPARPLEGLRQDMLLRRRARLPDLGAVAPRVQAIGRTGQQSDDTAARRLRQPRRQLVEVAAVRRVEIGDIHAERSMRGSTGKSTSPEEAAALVSPTAWYSGTAHISCRRTSSAVALSGCSARSTSADTRDTSASMRAISNRAIGVGSVWSASASSSS